tara:strand:- start:3170 stop:3412 length:243 start_codon:yes stop_codon:yes gene_type:complete
MEKPKLVDYSLFQKPKIIGRAKIKINNKIDNTLIINFIGFLILCIGGIYLYQRLNEKKLNELKKQNTIIGFHQYVKEKIK